MPALSLTTTSRRWTPAGSAAGDGPAVTPRTTTASPTTQPPRKHRRHLIRQPHIYLGADWRNPKEEHIRKAGKQERPVLFFSCFPAFLIPFISASRSGVILTFPHS